jgi:hypothetical protein
MADFQTVTFTEGAPLDINQLNTFQNNMTQIYSSTSSLTSSLKNAQNVPTVPVLDTGYIDLPSIAVTAVKYGPIQFSSSFNGKPSGFVASISKVLPAGVIATVYTNIDTSGNGYVYVIGNKAATLTNTSINWIAVQNKTV